MRHFLLLPLLFVLAGCIGHSSTPLSESSSAPLFAAEKTNPYEGVYNGLPQDAVILNYGAPSRRYSLDNGLKILEYSVRVRRVTYSKRREQDRCTLRFWISNKRVVHVDDIGNTIACVHFLGTKNRDVSINENDWPPVTYP